jgi:beta-phosphoglucomutase
LIKAILFDFDGVIAETFSSHLAAWKEIFDPEGIVPTKEAILLNEGSSARNVAKAIGRSNQRDFTDVQAAHYAEQKNKIFRSKSRVRIFPEVPLLVEKACALKLKIGLVTGASMANLKAVVPAALLAKFDCIVKDGDTERNKPFPDPYLQAAQQLAVTPQECLVIENALLGIQSAKEAGTFCVALMTTLTEEHLLKADVLYNNHNELLDHLEALVLRLNEG